MVSSPLSPGFDSPWAFKYRMASPLTLLGGIPANVTIHYPVKL